MLPRLSANSSTASLTLDTLGAGSWTTNLGLSQPVLDATTIFGVVGALQQNSLNRSQSRQTIASLILDVENAYLNLAKSQAIVASARRQKLRAEENLRIVTKRHELEDASRAEKLRAEASFLAAETELLSAMTSLETNQRLLSDFIGLDGWKNIIAEDLPDAEEPDSLSTTIITGAILENNPDYDLLRKQVKLSELNYWRAWGGILPSLSFSANKIFNQDQVLPSFSDWDDAPTSYGLSVSFPIVDVKQRILDINGSKLDRKESRINLAKQVLAFRQRLAGLQSAQETSYMSWEVAEKNVEVSTEAYRLTSRSYQLGASSLADLLVVEAELVQAERSLVEAKASYWSSRAELNYFLGTGGFQ